MPYNGSVTFEQAEKARADRLSVGKKRFIPPRLGVVEELKKKKIHIFNVGPWRHEVGTGSTGKFIIPACPFGQEYIEMLRAVPDGKGKMVMESPISVVMDDDLVIKSEDEYTRLQDDGRKFAHEVVGDGRGQSPAYSLRHVGVFVAEGDKPTKEELAEARRLLQAKCSEICKFADTLHATDRKAAGQIIKPEVHFVAARVLGRDNERDSPWMATTLPAARVKCDMCAAVCEADAAKCSACGYVINEEKYKELLAKQRRLEGAAK